MKKKKKKSNFDALKSTPDQNMNLSTVATKP